MLNQKQKRLCYQALSQWANNRKALMADLDNLMNMLDN